MVNNTYVNTNKIIKTKFILKLNQIASVTNYKIINKYFIAITSLNSNIAEQAPNKTSETLGNDKKIKIVYCKSYKEDNTKNTNMQVDFLITNTV